MAKVIRTLREKRARLREIEREASRLRAELRMIREAVGQAAAPQRSPRRARRRRRVEPGPTSPLGLAVAALRARGRPLRINRLLEAIERRSFGRRASSTRSSRSRRPVPGSPASPNRRVLVVGGGKVGARKAARPSWGGFDAGEEWTAYAQQE